jgi:hypothetical protein
MLLHPSLLLWMNLLLLPFWLGNVSPVEAVLVGEASSRGMIRRAMDNNNSHQQRGQESHHRHRHSTYYMYQEPQQQKKQKYRSRTQQAEATLPDVWLCLAFALGWATWFLSSFLNTDLMRFAKSESVLVHGNVREVSIEDDQDGSGVPQYFAIIDYFITVRSKAEASRIQVRKAFQTQNLLQQGFANVELLVLPEEPTSSVLKEDWEREVAAQEQTEEDIISIGGFGDMTGSISGTGKTSGAALEKKPSTTLSRVDIWAKRASLVLSACLVTLSLIGAVNAVHRISSERVATVGWISVTVGSVFLWPLAMLCLKIMTTCQRILRLPTEKSGTIRY